MNKYAFFVLSLFLTFSCKTNSQEGLNINELKESFKNRDAKKFSYQFPADFKTFNKYFGWNEIKDKPELLYSESNEYIDYFFKILENKKYESEENKIIKVCNLGKWDADAVNYFQDKTISFIKKKNKYYLINDLDSNKAKSVLFFLFDSPHPTIDKEFESHLNLSKKKILSELFNDQLSLKDETSNSLSFYEKNDSYFIKSIDINNDGLIDKVVSSKPYNGNKLILFLNVDKKFKFKLETINFSQDGGNIISEINNGNSSESNFILKTTFPDRGLNEVEYKIIYRKDKFYLSETICRTNSNLSQDSFIYICKSKYNIELTKIDKLESIEILPSEDKRDKICDKEFTKKKNNSKQYKIYDKDGYTNLREEEDSKSKVLEKINSGDIISVLHKDGDWWLVETKKRNRGYVHKSRIISE